MRIFSSLKNLFRSTPYIDDTCVKADQIMYTQTQVNELCDYWKMQIEKAKQLTRKECLVDSKKIIGNQRDKIIDTRPSRGGVKATIRGYGAKRFVKECCLYNPSLSITAEQLWKIYLWWCKIEGLIPCLDFRGLSLQIDKRRIRQIRMRVISSNKKITIYELFSVKEKILRKYEEMVQSGSIFSEASNPKESS